MGKRNITRDDIKAWHEKGWKFRIKKSKNRKYITRRKGSRFEKSLGPFDPDLWQMILELENDEKKNQSWNQVFNEINFMRGMINSINCKYVNSEGYCMYWQWKKETYFLEKLEDIGYSMKKILDEKGVERVILYSNPIYCEHCSNFRKENSDQPYLL
jgi:hypothetical protein